MPHLPLNRTSIVTLVHEFYDQVHADSELGPVFNAVLDQRWGAHLEVMVEFWSTVMLGSRSFQGNVYGKHMQLTGIALMPFS